MTHYKMNRNLGLMRGGGSAHQEQAGSSMQDPQVVRSGQDPRHTDSITALNTAFQGNMNIYLSQEVHCTYIRVL